MAGGVAGTVLLGLGAVVGRDREPRRDGDGQHDDEREAGGDAELGLDAHAVSG